MSDRIIFHADCNNFFASCECLERPDLRLVPMAVAGDPESRKPARLRRSEAFMEEKYDKTFDCGDRSAECWKIHVF